MSLKFRDVKNNVKNSGCGRVFKNFREYARPLMLMLSAVVGVGFVSGAEIYSFYARFGKFWWLGVLTFAILFFCLTYKIVSNSCNNEKLFKLHNIKQNSQNNTFLVKSYIKNILLFFSVLTIAGAMFAGLKDLIWQLFNNNNVIIYCVCVICVFFILLAGLHGIEKFNYFVIAFMLFIVICVLIFGFKADVNLNNLLASESINLIADVNDKTSIFESEISFKNITMPIIFAGAYVFMNIVQIQPIANALTFSFNKRQTMKISAMLTGVLTVIIILFVLFLHNNNPIAQESMPMLTFFQNLQNPALLIIFVFGLILGLLSTLLACLIGVKQTLAKKIESNIFQTFLAVMLALVLGLLEFSIFVEVLYPIIGVVSFIIFVFL